MVGPEWWILALRAIGDLNAYTSLRWKDEVITLCRAAITPVRTKCLHYQDITCAMAVARAIVGEALVVEP